MAGRLGGAGGEDRSERALGVLGIGEEGVGLGPADALEDRGAHALAMAPQVDPAGKVPSEWARRSIAG